MVAGIAVNTILERSDDTIVELALNYAAEECHGKGTGIVNITEQSRSTG